MTLPTSLSLASVSGEISASPINSNYAAVQAAVNGSDRRPLRRLVGRDVLPGRDVDHRRDGDPGEDGSRRRSTVTADDRRLVCGDRTTSGRFRGAHRHLSTGPPCDVEGAIRRPVGVRVRVRRHPRRRRLARRAPTWAASTTSRSSRPPSGSRRPSGRSRYASRRRRGHGRWQLRGWCSGSGART